MARLIGGTINSTVSVTFTTSQTWTSPVGVVNLISVVGKGADGAPAVPPTYNGDVARSATVETLRGLQYSSEYSPYPSQNNFGTWDWAASQNDAPTCASTINVGGSGTVYGVSIYQYALEYHYIINEITFTNAITGSAVATTDPYPIWKTSGLIEGGDFGSSYVSWSELGTYSGGSGATTGASSTGFGKTFTGGVGVAAVASTYTNVTITASTGYPIVVPSGGYITIVY